MTWEEVLRLDPTTLRMQLARWQTIAIRYDTREPVVYWDNPSMPDGLDNRPWNPLEDWRDAMALAWQYGLTLHMPAQPECLGSVLREGCPAYNTPMIWVRTPEEMRLGISRMAFYIVTKGGVTG